LVYDDGPGKAWTHVYLAGYSGQNWIFFRNAKWEEQDVNWLVQINAFLYTEKEK